MNDDSTGGAPVIQAQGVRLTGDIPQTEAHAARPPQALPAGDGRAGVELTFPAEAPAQSITLTYRPPAVPGDAPEVELHGFTRWSDVRLKRAIRAI